MGVDRSIDSSTRMVACTRQGTIEGVLTGRISVREGLTVRRRAYASHSVDVPTGSRARVRVVQDASAAATVVEVFAPDEIGLLATVAGVFADLGFDVTLAKVATTGELAVDVFYVRDHGAKVLDPAAHRRVGVRAARRARSHAIRFRGRWMTRSLLRMSCAGPRRSRRSPVPGSGSPRASTSASASRRCSRSPSDIRAAAIEEAEAEALYEEWLETVGKGVAGYVTPKVAVAAIVGNERGEILLTQRADSGIWLYPVGWADVGYSPSEIAVKEVYEETGIEVEPVSLIAVLDGLRLGFARIPMYSLVFHCRMIGGELRGHPLETRAVGFFARDALPAAARRAAPLGRARVPRDRRRAVPGRLRSAAHPSLARGLSPRRPEAGDLSRRAGAASSATIDTAPPDRSHSSPIVSWSTRPLSVRRDRRCSVLGRGVTTVDRFELVAVGGEALEAVPESASADGLVPSGSAAGSAPAPSSRRRRAPRGRTARRRAGW